MSDEQFTVYGTLIRAGPRSRVFARKTVPTTATGRIFTARAARTKPMNRPPMPTWLKQTGPLHQVKLRGLEKVDWLFVFSCAAHNLIRMPRLMAQPPARLTVQCA